MAEQKTVGIIGQMYENRTSGKIGKIVERDEKFRTLLMEAPDGATFNISFASLKSNWRKSAVQVEESEPEILEPIESISFDEIKEQANEKHTRATRKITAKMLYTDELIPSAEKIIEAIGRDDVSMIKIPNHNGVAFKVGHRRYFEIYAKGRAKGWIVFMSEETYNSVNWSESLNLVPSNVTFEPNFVLKVYFGIAPEVIDDALNDIAQFISTVKGKED